MIFSRHGSGEENWLRSFRKDQTFQRKIGNEEEDI